MRSFWRGALCLLLAFAAFAVLISPLVPSLPTALRATQAAHAFHVGMVMFANALSGRLSVLARQAWIADAAAGPHTGRDVVDLTAARLC